MTARIRADLDALPGYLPGRTVAGAIKLASNEVSAGPLPSVVAAISDAAGAVNRYPDSAASTLVDALALAREHRNVAVMRTFAKAYGLAGLRVGYCVAAEPVTAALRKVYVPFSVNSLAQVAALASLDAAGELLARCRDVLAERDRVCASLREMSYPVPESHANFGWLPLREATTAFTEHCREHRVVVRGFAGHGVRVTVGDPGENEAFLAAARSFQS